jgi:phospholipid/cholesterol/gamma-HCH transport system permease protein
MAELLGLRFSKKDAGILIADIYGVWELGPGQPTAADLRNQIGSFQPVKQIQFDTRSLKKWDSSLLLAIQTILRLGEELEIPIDVDGLPTGVRGLWRLAAAGRSGDPPEARTPPGLLFGIGEWLSSRKEALRVGLDFLGELVMGFTRLMAGNARFRASDLGQFLQDCGPKALPIVSLISFLVGLILAFVGAVQLRMFGAQIYVADLVGLGMAREMGAIMAGVIMAGRTGSAFAAQIGTMQVNEEVDALVTMGISPIDFLVVPRVLSLTILMPLLCVYANLLGILGGLTVGIGMLDIPFSLYLSQTQNAVRLTDFGVGVFKSIVFGFLIAYTGCLRGLLCGRSATAVGHAVTSAVVDGIVCIVVFDALFAVLFEIIGI